MTIDEKIAKARREKRLTQEELADRLGVSRQAVSKRESGAALPETDKLARLSGLLGVSCDYLLCDDASEEQGNAFGRPKQETQTAQTLNQVKVIRTRPERRLLRVLRTHCNTTVGIAASPPQSIAKCALSGCEAIASG